MDQTARSSQQPRPTGRALAGRSAARERSRPTAAVANDERVRHAARFSHQRAPDRASSRSRTTHPSAVSTDASTVVVAGDDLRRDTAAYWAPTSTTQPVRRGRLLPPAHDANVPLPDGLRSSPGTRSAHAAEPPHRLLGCGVVKTTLYGPIARLRRRHAARRVEHAAAARLASKLQLHVNFPRLLERQAPTARSQARHGLLTAAAPAAPPGRDPRSRSSTSTRSLRTVTLSSAASTRRTRTSSTPGTRTR